ncbi:MAG TPA: hypothetical protein VGP47_08075 [Parachlamydiaceae bacterium]|nr:hypothetical protein [Parachlamydiaceae bacterium]
MSVPIVNPLGTVVIPSTASSHSLQAFIELVYIRTANDVLVSQMVSLEAALATTKSAMDSLTQLQNLKNLATVKGKGQFNPGAFSTNSSASTYTSAASAFFATPVSVSVSFAALSGGYASFLSQMQAIASQLSSQIAALSATTPLISGRVDSNSLLAKLQVVLKSIYATHAASTQAGAIAWITDKRNLTSSTSVVSAGLIQQDITNAITAGQSLNTTQTESVRNFLYMYEEYYKSASAVLQAITRIIQKMAENAGR